MGIAAKKTRERRVTRKLNRFAIVFDTLIAIHGHTEVSLLKAIGKRPNRLNVYAMQCWRKAKTFPRISKYRDILEKIEDKFQLPRGRLANLSGGRSSHYYRAIKRINFASAQLLRWHTPDDFDLRAEKERQEIMTWISENILPCSTAFGRYQSKSTKTKFAVVFPSLPKELGGRAWMGDRLRRHDLVEKFKAHGAIPAPARLAREMSQIVTFHRALLPPNGYRRRRRWSKATASTVTSRLGIFLGALAAAKDRYVNGMGVPVAHLTTALFVFPEVWEWYLDWCEKRRGFYTSSEKNLLYDIRLLARRRTGWIRQHPRLARRLKPIEGLISQKDINRARADWGTACDKVFEYTTARISELSGIIRVHRDPFAPILPVLTNERPLAEYKKIGDEMLRRLPNEQARPMSFSTAVRNYLMFRFALHLGLRQRNFRELLLCPPGQKARDISTLEDLERGEIRWNSGDRVWEVFIPAIAIKNGSGEFFRGRPFQATLPDLENLYWWIKIYLWKHRARLLDGNRDPGTFFVRSMRSIACDPELNITSFYSVWKLMILQYGIYNPYTKRGAIKGLLAHGPHAVRDVLATHLLKTTGSYELASYAIQDSIESVLKHYARFMPHEKIARAAEELNKVWKKPRTTRTRKQRKKGELTLSDKPLRKRALLSRHGFG
ncbi:MAG: hypothetical protein ABI824_18980 [Acidobacteriota bacterium]